MLRSNWRRMKEEAVKSSGQAYMIICYLVYILSSLYFDFLRKISRIPDKVQVEQIQNALFIERVL
jgi:hypothetical protein